MRYSTNRRRPASLFEVCALLCEALDHEHLWWRDCFGPDDVAEWLAERWPLPAREVSNIPGLASSCLSDLEETLFEALA